MKCYKGKIEQWYLQSSVAIYSPLEAGQYVCIGKLNGDHLRTGFVVVWTPHMVETANAIYSLGKPYGKE